MTVGPFRLGLFAALALAGCQEGTVSGDGGVLDALDGAVDAIEPAEADDGNAEETGVAPQSPAYPTTWEIVHASDAPQAVVAAAQDVGEILSDRWGFAVTFSNDIVADDCASRTGRVIFAGDGIGQPKFTTDNVTSQTWSVREARCDRGTAVTLAGGSPWARQVAAYRMLERWGVRFFHPEETYVPETPWWSAEPMSAEDSGRVAWRAFETSLALTDAETDRLLRWQVANGATVSVAGSDAALAARGLARALVADAFDAGSIADDVMSAKPALVVIDATEVTGEPNDNGETLLAGVAAAADAVAEADGSVTVAVRIDVGATLDDGTPVFELVPQLPLAVEVQLLFGAGERFRAADGSALRAMFDAQILYRRFQYAVETGAAGGFDAPMGAVGEVGVRLNDLEAWAHWAAAPSGGWTGVQVVNHGQEWGRWAIDRAVLRAGADLGADETAAYLHLAAPWPAAARAAVVGVLAKAATVAKAELYDGGVWSLLAAPLAKGPTQAVVWNLAELGTWEGTDSPALARLEEAAEAAMTDLALVAPAAGTAEESWAGELFDASQATALWARHVKRSVDVVAMRRRAALRFEDDLVEASAEAALRLPETTMAALALVQRRASRYRREGVPKALERAQEVAAYRELEAAAAAGLTSLSGLIVLDDALLGPDELLTGDVVADGAGPFTMAFGDGNSETGMSFEHGYVAPGVYVLAADGTVDGEAATFAARVVQVTEEHTTGLTGAVLSPEGVSLIDPAFPALTFGRLPDGVWVMGYGREGDGNVALDQWTTLTACEETPETLSCTEAAILLAAKNPFGDEWLGSIELLNVTTTLDWTAETATITGNVLTGPVVQLIQNLLGIDQAAAVETVAALLMYPPEALPVELPFEALYALQPGTPASP